MLESLLSPKWIVLALIIASAVYVHYRGRVRHGFFRQLTDHSTLFAPYNVLMYAFSKVGSNPFVDIAAFPELAKLRDNWQVLREEGLQLFDEGYIRAATKNNDIGFHSLFKGGYQRFFVKWYDTPHPSARQHCPKTVALIESIPMVNAAMFAVLLPGGKLGAHRDPFAGSLRYHLGLATPNADSCYIAVDGMRYAWQDGKDVVFDETYIHSAENQSNVTRLILFCDIDRPLPKPMSTINKFFRNTVMRATQTENVEGDKVGVVNQIFSYVYHVRLFGKAIKAKSKFAYYTLKWLLIGGILYLIFLR